MVARGCPYRKISNQLFYDFTSWCRRWEMKEGLRKPALFNVIGFICSKKKLK